MLIFEHVLHFSGLTYARHRVQRVKMGRFQPELALNQIVSQTAPFMADLPLLMSEVKETFHEPLSTVYHLAENRHSNVPELIPIVMVMNFH